MSGDEHVNWLLDSVEILNGTIVDHERTIDDLRQRNKNQFDWIRTYKSTIDCSRKEVTRLLKEIGRLECKEVSPAKCRHTFKEGERVCISANSTFVGRYGTVIELRADNYLTVQIDDRTRLWIKDCNVSPIDPLHVGVRVKFVFPEHSGWIYNGWRGTVKYADDTHAHVYVDGVKSVSCVECKNVVVISSKGPVPGRPFAAGDRIQVIATRNPFWRMFGLITECNRVSYPEYAVAIDGISEQHYFNSEELALER